MRHIRFVLPRALGAALLLVVCAAAVPRTALAEDAGAFVAGLGNEALQLARVSVPPAARAAGYRQLFQNHFDVAELGRFVLGQYGRSLPSEQQQEFTTLLRERLVQSYSRRLAQYAGSQFRVTGTHGLGGEIVVTSLVQPLSGTPIQIDWHLVDQSGHFLVADVVVDGVSQRLEERNEVAGLIQRSGGRADAVLAVLRQEVAQPAEPMAGSSSARPSAGPYRP